MSCLDDYPYAGSCEDNRDWHNWLGNVRYTVPRYFVAATHQDLVSILQAAEAQGKKVKAVGSGWSFEDCAASEDWVVDIAELNKKIIFLTEEATGPVILTPEWRDRQFGASGEKLYHAEAGISLFKLNTNLQEDGLAMFSLGGSQGQTLAGAISTSTHGSNLDQPPLPGLVQAIHLVTTGGREVWIESASEPLTANDDALRDALRSELDVAGIEIIRDDSLLRAARVTVGRFGVIYSYVIKVTALFRFSEFTQELSVSSVSDALAAGVGQGSDVPLRAHLGDLPGLLANPPAGLEISTGTGDFDFLDILINPKIKERHGDKTCWVRRRWLTDSAQDLNLSAPCNPLCHVPGGKIVLEATITALAAYAGTIVSIPVVGIIKANGIVADTIHLKLLALDPTINGGTALAESLNAIFRGQIDDQLEWLVAHINHMALGLGLGESTNDGRRGPGWQIMAGLTEDATSGCYYSNSIELIFSTETRAYLDFVGRLLDDVKDFDVGGTSRFDSPVVAMRTSPCTMSVHRWRHRSKWCPFMASKVMMVGSRI
jgi:hypothetical protein